MNARRLTLSAGLAVFIAGSVIAAALGVVLSKNPVHSVLFLIMTFFACSAIWLMLEAEFLAITLVLVYVGAVMVLFLFVVMMLNIKITEISEKRLRYLPIGALLGVLFLADTCSICW